ncbi:MULTISPECIES: alpha/beta hydrolase [Desertifilum]|nr:MULTISPECIES: alpha/beta hydrolase [Desertifilum]
MFNKSDNRLMQLNNMLYRHFQNQAELDEQYNAAKAGLDLLGYLEFYTQSSERVRSLIPHHLNVSYGPTLAEHLDIFPANQPLAPILVFIHGGYWVMLSSQDFSFVAQGPFAGGVTTIVPNYALCPKVTIDEIVRQNRAAIAWIYKNAESFGGDPNRIFVSGHSAGGHLTAMLMATDWEDYGLPHDVIKGGFAISGLFDLMPFPYTWLQPQLQFTWDQVLRNSPIYHIPKQASPLIITYGEEETPEFHRQSQEFLTAWKANNLPGKYLPQPQKHHLDVIDGFLDPQHSLCQSLFQLMGVQ